ncbi:hypothetical protein TNIN_466311 [Trichonephila inaurata madagascariensis]|uniref:Uncharacterized protein n=1 Tax=Trichonephila inaurata madagascariensis TaxID=2747483 RepID=A0A8X7BPY6_9ARAC|nr:hypothetical protein TNIN_466311 [Trichonephila inaurata madagascariensis]
MLDEIFFPCSCYNLKKRPPPQPRIEITAVGDLYAYLEAEKLRYVRLKFHNERLNEKRMLYVLEVKTLPLRFPFKSYVVAFGFTRYQSALLLA